MNETIAHPDQPEMQVEPILCSVSPQGQKLYTFRLRYPRIIHAELMTHRVFSRNARSSRAVPVARMLEEIREKPFVPWHWGKNQKGMQAGGEHNDPVLLQEYPNYWDFDHPVSREHAWIVASKTAADMAEAFMDAGYHKQLVNRLLEPFMWIDTLITTTSWSNFLWLRDHKDAEPHLRDLAALVGHVVDFASLQELEPGQWHLPYILPEDYTNISGGPVLDRRALHGVSAARCARISYTPFDGNPSYKKELERYDSLVSSDRIHASPLEHQATPDRVDTWGGLDWCNPHLHGNLPGWIQYRKLIPGECA